MVWATQSPDNLQLLTERANPKRIGLELATPLDARVEKRLLHDDSYACCRSRREQRAVAAKFSNNVMAQQLFLTLGLTQRLSGTPRAARAVLRLWLADRLGPVAADQVVIDNGSGLSRDTQLSARLLARLLQSAWASPVMPELMASLPVAGIDGTPRHGRVSVGRAHLKTGSLRDVAGIAGYVLSSAGRRYIVVGIVNHASSAEARPALDALVSWATNDGR